MKKIINGKKYDTDTAKEICEYANTYDVRDLDYERETLYRKRTGEFFLHGDGGPRSKYGTQSGPDSWGGGAEIIPLTDAEAMSFAEKHMDADAYEEVFGEAEE